MPEIVVIFSCQSLRFSISLKCKARTEKSPQPGHHVGWSAVISFRVSALRSVDVAGAAEVAGAAGVPVPALFAALGFSITGALIKSIQYRVSLSKFTEPFRDARSGTLQDLLHLPGETVRL